MFFISALAGTKCLLISYLWPQQALFYLSISYILTSRGIIQFFYFLYFYPYGYWVSAYFLLWPQQALFNCLFFYISTPMGTEYLLISYLWPQQALFNFFYFLYFYHYGYWVILSEYLPISYFWPQKVYSFFSISYISTSTGTEYLLVPYFWPQQAIFHFSFWHIGLGGPWILVYFLYCGLNRRRLSLNRGFIRYIVFSCWAVRLASKSIKAGRTVPLISSWLQASPRILWFKNVLDLRVIFSNFSNVFVSGEELYVLVSGLSKKNLKAQYDHPRPHPFYESLRPGCDTDFGSWV